MQSGAGFSRWALSSHMRTHKGKKKEAFRVTEGSETTETEAKGKLEDAVLSSLKMEDTFSRRGSRKSLSAET